jgi:oxazoline/thiazoline dehydrogenase
MPSTVTSPAIPEMPLSLAEAIHVELRAGVELHRDGAAWTLRVDGHAIAFRLPGGPACDLFDTLRRGRCSLAMLASLPAEHGRVTASTELRKLWRSGWLAQIVSSDGLPLATLHNYGDLPLFPVIPPASTRVQLSADALVRRVDRDLAIESIQHGAIVRCSDARLAALPGLLFRPASIGALPLALDLPPDVCTAVAAWLIAIGAAITADPRGPAQGWSFADRLLHARSRRGRHIGGYGATFPLRDVIPEPPAVRPIGNGRITPLPAPDLASIGMREGSFHEVFARRKSIREHAPAPLRLEELAEFLYRVARVTAITDAGPYRMAARPYPSGGGLHELDIYPLVNRCDDLPPGLYRYDGSAHRLEHIIDPSPATQQLLAEARATCLMRGEPHVLLLMAARFSRVMWKYESISYALILKNLGVLYQTMYLVATAMSLAPCGLGGGNADGFAAATGADYWEESLVGEFMLGRPADAGHEQTGSL